MPGTLGLAESLSTLVKNKYRSAKAAEALSFAATELAIVHVAGIPFQLRYCPSLASKPQPTAKPEAKEKNPPQKFDPFENPAPDLLVTSVPAHKPSHNVVLNKFPIIQNHFILATKEDKPQTHLLEQDDLAITLQCLKEWSRSAHSGARSDERLFAFFNSGDHSGASQPHRHLQFLPVKDIAEGDTKREWTLLTDEIMAGAGKGSTGSFSINASIPFVHFGLELPQDPSPEQLHDIYVRLYNASVSAVRNYISTGAGDLELHPTEGSHLPISYNLAMTSESMVICPRRRGGDVIRRQDGSEIDAVELNGTLLGGTLMVKNEELWHVLQKQHARLGAVLGEVGIPPAKVSHSL